MKFIKIDHTLAAIEKIKKELSILMIVISVICTTIFSFYYAYLIYKNINILPNLIAYIILFSTVIVTFVIELVLKTTKEDSRKTKRIKLERKRFISNFTKILKYLAKCITVTIAVYNSINKNELDLSIFMNFISCAVLVITLLFEFIMIFVNRYIDYIKLAVELDIDSNFILSKVIFRNETKYKNKERKKYALLSESPYTLQEEKIIKMLTTDAEILRKEKDEQYEIKNKNIKLEIKELSKKLPDKQKEKVDKKFVVSLNEANILINVPDKLDELLIKAEELIDKLPENVSSLKYIPEFLSLINNYISGRYKDVSVKSVVAVIAVIIYFVAPYDVIPDFIPKIGYLDETYVVDKCLDIINDDLDKFLTWRNNKVNC